QDGGRSRGFRLGHGPPDEHGQAFVNGALNRHDVHRGHGAGRGLRRAGGPRQERGKDRNPQYAGATLADGHGHPLSPAGARPRPTVDRRTSRCITIRKAAGSFLPIWMPLPSYAPMGRRRMPRGAPAAADKNGETRQAPPRPCHGCLPALAPGRLRLLLSAYSRLVVMLALAQFALNDFFALSLPVTAQSPVEILILANSLLGHRDLHKLSQ